MAWYGYGGQCECPQLISVLTVLSASNAPVVQLGDFNGNGLRCTINTHTWQPSGGYRLYFLHDNGSFSICILDYTEIKKNISNQI